MSFLRQVNIFTFLAVAVTMGCVDIEGPRPPALGSDQILSELRFSSRAIIMNAADTMEAGVRGVAMDGSSITVNRGEVIWRSLDSAIVYIDTLGRISSRVSKTGSPVGISASWTLHGVTRFDTISVQVTENRSDVTGVKLVSLDSTTVGSIETTAGIQPPRIRVDLYNGDQLVQAGAELPISVPSQVTAGYDAPSSKNNNEAGYFIRNQLTYLGPFWVRASVNLYGNEVSDSLLFQGVYPSLTTTALIAFVEGDLMEIEMGPDDPVPAIQPCGWVVIGMLNLRDRSVDVVFSDSTADETGCEEIPVSLLQAGWNNMPFSGSFTGGIARGLHLSGPFPFGWWVRRSNTVGQISWYMRDATTGERLPISGRYNQVTVD